jgi:hypothetical protein
VTECCPHCRGTGLAPPAADVRAIEAMAASLRAACEAAKAPISGDDRVDETTAAMLLGKSRKTLANWRFIDRPLAFVTRRGRVFYELAELARWLVENGDSGEI